MLSKPLCSLTVALLAVLLATPFLAPSYVHGDFEQCRKRCRHRGGSQLNETHCECGDGKIERLKNRKAKLGYPHVSVNAEICTSYQRTFPSVEALNAEGRFENEYVIHCSSCGACSSESDVEALRELANNIASKVGPCVIRYLMFGLNADVKCLTKNVGFSKPCATCWAHDHQCMSAHCHSECVLKGLARWRSLIDSSVSKVESSTKNDPCMTCMDHYCTKPMIDECGTNRRAAGITSETERDVNEVCTRVEPRAKT